MDSPWMHYTCMTFATHAAPQRLSKITHMGRIGQHHFRLKLVVFIMVS